MRETQPTRRNPDEVIVVPQTEYETFSVIQRSLRLSDPTLSEVQRDEIAASIGNTMNRPKVVTGEQILRFCNPCVHCNQDGRCTLPFGGEDQPRHVAQNWCWSAQVDGVNGKMTADTFNDEPKACRPQPLNTPKFLPLNRLFSRFHENAR